MSTDVSPWAMAEESRLSACMCEMWPSVPDAPYLPARAPELLGAPPARVRAVFEAFPDGCDLATLLHLTALSWDELYPLVDKAMRVGRLRMHQRRSFMSQGQQVAGKVVYQLQEPKRRSA